MVYAFAAAASSFAAIPVTSFGFWRNCWKRPHSPWPAVAPNEAGWLSDMSNTIDFALCTGTAVARVIGSG